MNIRKRFVNSETTVSSLGRADIFGTIPNTITVDSGTYYINGHNTNITTTTIPEQTPNTCGFTVGGEWIINGTNTNIAVLAPSESGTGIPFSANVALYSGTGVAAFKKNLELLNTRLDSIKKELSYWNFYQFTHQVTVSTDLDSVFAELTPGKALIINCDSFQQGEETYYRGTAVVKLLDGSAAKVDPLSQGIYYPTACTNAYISSSKQPVYKNPSDNKYYTQITFNNGAVSYGGTAYASDSSDITKNGFVTIAYNYTDRTPSEDTSLKETYAFSFDTTSTNNLVYGIYCELGDTDSSGSNYDYTASSKTITFDKYTYTPSTGATRIIRPIIRFIDKNNETFNADYSLTLSNNIFTLVITSQLPSGTNYIIIK